MKYRVVLKSESGTVFSRMTFSDETEAQNHKEILRTNANEIFRHTSEKLLIMVSYYMPKDDWVEDDIESILL